MSRSLKDLAAVLLLLALAFLVRGITVLCVALESYGWSAVPGSVVDSHISRFRPDGARHGSDLYRAEITYRYAVDGFGRRGNLLYLGYSSDRTRDGAQAWLDRFPPDQAVVVYVNPEDSTQSVLITGISIEDFADLLTGSLLVAVASAMLRRSRRR
ncbi:DUF3592 domain-containing protein [Ferrimonas sediminicola]|uniref:DUF3592 domain-containing protein n=1 Tax=Ferrimonas sediminicola TaxID=2569538 RepID=A0A4U1BEF5_9GAMM|nr:DUF3592 domain-containing protein [Ferrimonas sediminicola]TKB48370.1 DUF3592 domain-containing protein [Ferrimonas sediminicola]